MHWIRVALSVLIVVVLVPAQALAQARVVTIHDTDMSSGIDMYRQYCAACHGADGRGTAKAAAALNKAIPDLTTIQQRNGTREVARYVQTLLRESSTPGHELRGMPGWEPILFRVSGGRDDLATLRRVNISTYIGSLQRK